MGFSEQKVWRNLAVTNSIFANDGRGAGGEAIVLPLIEKVDSIDNNKVERPPNVFHSL